MSRFTKPAKYRLIAVEEGALEEVTEGAREAVLINRAVRDMKDFIRSGFKGNLTWFVLEVETNKIVFHAGIGRPQHL